MMRISIGDALERQLNQSDLMQCAERMLRELGADAPGWVPAEHVGRQAWQKAVEATVAKLRTRLAQPAFGLSQPEISIFYHRPIEDFVALVRHRAGLQ